jgi:hypothetical protein
MTPKGGAGRGQGRKFAPITGRRVNIYLAADLVEFWEALPHREKSEYVNQALRERREKLARELAADCAAAEQVQAERIAALEAERTGLAVMLGDVVYHMTHSMDCKHGDGFTYDFCPVAKANEMIKKVVEGGDTIE